MTEPKFTPGPWKHKDNYIYAPIPDEDDVLEISIAVACTGVAPAEANATLISAAPDMYEALEAYDKAEADILENANWYTESGVPQITQEQFNRLVDCQTLKAKALRKARGEE